MTDDERYQSMEAIVPKKSVMAKRAPTKHGSLISQTGKTTCFGGDCLSGMLYNIPCGRNVDKVQRNYLIARTMAVPFP